MIIRIRSRVSADDPVEDRTDHVLGALADLVADLALHEDLLASSGVLRHGRAHRSKERRPRKRKTQQPHIVLPDLSIPSRPYREASRRADRDLASALFEGKGCPFVNTAH